LSIEESAVLKGRVELKPGASQSASAPQTASAPAAVSPETLVLQPKA
jgi:hypothetical protein